MEGDELEKGLEMQFFEFTKALKMAGLLVGIELPGESIYLYSPPLLLLDWRKENGLNWLTRCLAQSLA